jgi:uncharacterized protein (DUF2267 family)
VNPRFLPIFSIFVVLLAGMSAARAATVASIDVPIPALKDGRRISLAAIEQAVLTDCRKRNFVCTVTAPDVIAGKFTHNRSYNAEVTIPFSEQSFQIRYKDSVGMKYNADRNKIAGDYNAWVEALAEHIEAHVDQAIKRLKKGKAES